jgi:hypothetical protein
MIDKSLIPTDVATPYRLTEAEAARILESLRRNGVAAVRGLVARGDVAELRKTAEAATTAGMVYGAANSLLVKVIESDGTRDFHHPFLISGAATRVVTSGALLDLVEAYLGNAPIIHHGLFQRSLPLEEMLLDWHIDCGSNKKLNGVAKFPDVRLRSILYLSDVESGGLGYILDSAAKAKAAFLPLPNGQLFPTDQVPPDPARRVMMNEPAGTLILFDTHGLHRPEVPKQERLVMNVWFARKDFSAKLPPVLFSVANVPPENRDRISVFDNARGSEAFANAEPPKRPNIIKRLVRRLVA